MNSTPVSFLEQVASHPNDQAWEKLHSLYAPLLNRWLAKYQIQAADAEDLVQDVLTTLVRELPNFHHNQRSGAFRRWLRLTLANRVQAFWRSGRYRPEASGQTDFPPLAELESDATSISQIWSSEHDKSVMSHLLASVRPRFDERTWEAFHRQMMDGQPADVIAADLDMSLAAVYQAKARILKILRHAARGLIDDL